MSPYERGRKGNAFREGARCLPHEGNAGLGQRGSGRLAVTGLVNWETGGATIRTSLQGKPTTLGCMCASTYCKLHGVHRFIGCRSARAGGELRRNNSSANKRPQSEVEQFLALAGVTLLRPATSRSVRRRFHRIKAQRGPKKAIVAVAASILTAIYHMLKDGTLYHELGPNHFHVRDKERQKDRLLKRLAQLGYTVALAPVPN